MSSSSAVIVKPQSLACSIGGKQLGLLSLRITKFGKRTSNKQSSKTEGTFVTPMRDFDVRSPSKTAGRNTRLYLHTSALAKDNVVI